MQLSTTAKALIVVGLIVAAIFAAGGMLFYNIKAVNDETTNTRRRVELTKRRVSQFESRQEIVANNRQEMRKVNEYLVPTGLEGTVAFLGRIEGLASSTGATIEARSVQQVDGPSEHVSRLSLTVDARGTWREVYHTLTLIENLPLDVHLSNIQLTRTERTGTANTDQTAGARENIWSMTADVQVSKSTEQMATEPGTADSSEETNATNTTEAFDATSTTTSTST